MVWTADRSTVLAESKQAIGHATNNVAEYRGLIAGLEEATKLNAAEVAVAMDSKLVVEQMSGRWKVKHPDLVELNARARALAARFERVSYTWIPRAENSYADRLANEAMDAAAEQTDAPSPAGHGNFPGAIPTVHRGPYEYASPEVPEDWLPQSTDLKALAGGKPEAAKIATSH